MIRSTPRSGYENLRDRAERVLQQAARMTILIVGGAGFIGTNLAAHLATTGKRVRIFDDQGWVAHFLNRAIAGAPITIYGDGKQVRDVLFVDDLVDAFVRAWSRIGAIAGRAFNIGGGPEQAVSLVELLGMIEALRGKGPVTARADWRPGDQRYYVSDTSAFTQATGWRPRVGPRAGIEALHGWLAGEGGTCAS